MRTYVRILSLYNNNSKCSRNCSRFSANSSNSNSSNSRNFWISNTDSRLPSRLNYCCKSIWIRLHIQVVVVCKAILEFKIPIVVHIHNYINLH
jgi:hypothetical protein